MARFKIFLFLQFVFFSALPVLAQVDTAWVARYNGPSNYGDGANALAVDASGNVYVTGRSYDTVTSYDYATIKYSSFGDTLWVRRYDYGPGNFDDVATALAVDDSGNLYVTGYSGYSIGSGTYSDYATIKYSSFGDTLWVRRYNGPGNDEDVALALAVDGSGNLYVTGYSDGDFTATLNYDYATIKYAPNGDTLWVRRYNGPGNGFDVANDLAVDNSGNVYVTGPSYNGTSQDYLTIKYAPNGDTLWTRRYNGSGDGLDRSVAIAVDDSGKVYVTGRSLGVGTDFDCLTIVYSSNGDSLWAFRYNGTGNLFDRGNGISVDGNGNVYVTGESDGVGRDYITIKYSSSGDTLWVRRYNGPGNDIDVATALAVDDSGNVYATGNSYASVTAYDYATIKYSSFGDTLWVRRYNGPGNGDDIALSLAIDDSGNVFVTGSSSGSVTFYDYATIKYVQFTCVDTAGDANGDGGVSLPI